MTFLGTIPNGVRSLLQETARAWPQGGDVWVACSGNFTIERLLHSMDRSFRLHSNDVSIYTSALGRWLTDQPVRLALSERASRYDVDWLADYVGDGVESVATIMLATHFFDDLGDDGVWARRNVDAHRRDWQRLHETTVQRLVTAKFPVQSFFCGDVVDYLDKHVPDDTTIASFPPFDVGCYEKLYKRLDEVFDWPEPEYEILDGEGLEAVVETITERPRWFIGRNMPYDEWHHLLVGKVQPSPSSRTMWLYASDAGHRRLVTAPSVTPEQVMAPYLKPGDTIGERMALAPLTLGQFIGIRAKFLNASIAVSEGQINYPHAVTVDGKVVGVIAFAYFTAADRIALLADFAVSPHDYPRLSKLVVMAALSKEAQRICERAWARRVREVQTAVFTNKPASMKYRGLMKIREREELGEGDAFRFKITYQGQAGQWTLTEALETWKSKWGQKEHADAAED
jgi:hypothetical protein